MEIQGKLLTFGLSAIKGRLENPIYVGFCGNDSEYNLQIQDIYKNNKDKLLYEINKRASKFEFPIVIVELLNMIKLADTYTINARRTYTSPAVEYNIGSFIINVIEPALKEIFENYIIYVKGQKLILKVEISMNKKSVILP